MINDVLVLLFFFHFLERASMELVTACSGFDFVMVTVTSIGT